MTKTVPNRLRDAADLFEKRNAEYGSNYRTFGKVMGTLFPDGFGPQPLSETELGRLVLISHLVTKLTRYTQSFRRGGHADSLDDMSVYAQMAAELDEEARPPTPPDSRAEKMNMLCKIFDISSEAALDILEMTYKEKTFDAAERLRMACWTRDHKAAGGRHCKAPIAEDPPETATDDEWERTHTSNSFNADGSARPILDASVVPHQSAQAAMVPVFPTVPRRY